MWFTGTNGLHPYYTGYNKMAAVWKTALDPLLQDCNHPPVITSNPGSRSNAENDTVSLDIDATDADSDQLTYSARNLPPGLSIHPSTGLISGIISYEAYTGTPYNVMVKVTDDGPLKRSDAVSFIWTIQNKNGPPVLTNPGNRTNSEGAFLSLQLEATDPDPGDTLAYDADGLPPGLGIDEDTGVISGTPSYEANAGSPFTVMVTATDPGAKTDSATFEWVVNNTNREPDLTKPVNQTTFEGSSTSLQLQASDPDPEDILSFGAQGLPGGLLINPATGLISGTVACTAAANSPYNVEVSVTDDSDPLLSDTETFSWTVSVANCEPVVARPADQIDSEGETVSLQVTAGDPDGDEALTFDAHGLPPGLSIDQDGLITGTLSFAANAGSPYTATVTATDPGGEQGSASFQWDVQNTNRSPVLQAIPDQNNDEDEIVSLQVQASDPDQDTLQYSIQDQPPGVFINADDGLIQGRIACGTAGTYHPAVTASDGDLADSETFTWHVFPAECIPPDVFAFIPVLLKQ
jgi:hypothetical protein